MLLRTVIATVLLHLLALSQVINAVVIRVENLPDSCDLSKCVQPDKTKLNIHLVAHTHDDVGWLKTVDQYYYGTRTGIQKAGVQYILDSVVEELIRNKDRRFIYVESAFFSMWWAEQNQEQRKIVQELVHTGQLEFINGGWSMNDEATCHYNSIIDQMTWGLRFLNDTFGRCGIPRVAWQIDPFGHSREHANMLAQMGFDALYFAREDYQDHSIRAKERRLEHVWSGSDDIGKFGDIFTGMMHMGYGPPSRMNWDLPSMGNDDEPVVDNPESDEYNVPRLVKRLVDYAKDYAKNYNTNNVMFPMGTDFQYQDAHVYFKNMDKLIQHVNKMSEEVKLFYSTPSCYTKALYDAKPMSNWTQKSDDYFPYASDPHAYWTGYFTSRPAIKRFERVGNNILQICKQVDALALNNGKFEGEVTKLREYMGVMQHHDAVTGTEKQHVANNYAKHLTESINGCLKVVSESYKKIQGISTDQTFCPQLNISSCAETEKQKSFLVNIYNPLAWDVQKVIRLPINRDEVLFYNVEDSMGNSVDSEIVNIPAYVQKLKERNTQADKELVFRARIPALGLSTYNVRAGTTRNAHSAELIDPKTPENEFSLNLKNSQVIFNKKGELIGMMIAGKRVDLGVSFEYYYGHDGDNRESKHRASGAYVFRPTSTETHSVGKLIESKVFTRKADNAIVHEVQQRFDSYIDLVIRVDSTKEYLEFDWVVGPINTSDKLGREVILKVTSDTIKNDDGGFYTDANGRQVLHRVLNKRPTWNLKVEEPIAGNYYPINSRIFIRDKENELQMTILNDRSQGGSSIKSGSIETMLHRRLLHDDSFGVGEDLNEPGVDGKGLIVRGSSYLVVDNLENSARIHRKLAQELFMAPLVSISKTAPVHKNFTGLTNPLPDNVHLLTLEQWNHNRYLLRLEHIFARTEHSELSKDVTLNLKNLFRTFEITSAQELTLSANQDVSALKNRLTFKYVPNVSTNTPDLKFDPKTLDVTLSPMQIRTFAVTIRQK